MDPSRYLVTTLAAAVTIVVTVVSLNVSVDPLGSFGTPPLAGLGDLKPEMLDREREAKLTSPALAQARSLILGTSRAAIGLDPDALDELLPGAYNLAFGAQSLHETRLILDALGPRLAGRPVALGLDFFAANAAFERDAGTTDRILALPRWRALAGIALSLDTAIASLATIAGHDRATFIASGREVTGRGHWRWNASYVASRGGPARMFAESEAAYAGEFYFPPPSRRFAWRQGGRDTCEDLRAIFRAARVYDIRLAAFVSPSHARQWEVVDALGLWTEFERFKRTIAAANEIAAEGGAPFAVLDFAGHFAETSAPAPDGAGELLASHWDSSHYREALGTIALQRSVSALVAPPGSFGAILDSRTMDTHLERLRVLRARWRTAHPGEHASVLARALGKRPASAVAIPPPDGEACAAATGGP
ncbi:MAG: hypothetical protein AB7S87_15765 [Burkholderiales bacterium]